MSRKETLKAVSRPREGRAADRELRQADRPAGAAGAPSRPTRTSRTMELGRLGANDHGAAGASYRVCFDNTPIATELTLLLESLAFTRENSAQNQPAFF